MIAFDAVTNGTSVTASWTHTVTGGSTLLIVAVAQDAGRSLTAITYNGISLTQMGVSATNGNTGRNLTIWYLANAPTGAHTVALTISGTGNYIGMSASYTGASPTGVPNASHSQSTQGVTNLTDSVTPTITSCWGVYVTEKSGSNSAPGAGATQRSASASFAFEWYDSNGTLTVGSNSMTATGTPGDVWSDVIIAIAPFQSAGMFTVF